MTLASLRTLAVTSALLLLPVLSSIVAKADTITISTAALAPVTLAPSNDTISLPDSTVAVLAGSAVKLSGGSFYVGNSPIPDQVIPFSFDETITVNGVTEIITIFGENDVTTAVDVVKIFAGQPVQFGDVTLTIDAFTSQAGGVDATLPLDLTADVTQTPEPSSLLLLCTGVLGAAATRRRKQQTVA